MFIHYYRKKPYQNIYFKLHSLNFFEKYILLYTSQYIVRSNKYLLPLFKKNKYNILFIGSSMNHCILLQVLNMPCHCRELF